MSDFLSIKGFDHLEFYVGNAKQAALFYSKTFGFTNTAYRGLETGERKTASYVMEQGEIRLVLSTALSPDHPISQSVLQHGDNIAVIALEVANAASAYRESTARGAIKAIPPTEVEDEYGIIRYCAVHFYGDILLKFVERSNYGGVFAPGFEPRHSAKDKGVGLTTIDHVVGNVELGAMDRWAQFLADTMGFELLVQFDARTISTQYSALMSKVMQNSTGKIKLPLNEPARGKRKSQIQEYLEYNQGPGIQHVACATNNIIKTVSQLRASGVNFLSVPKTYYENLNERIGKIDEPVDKLAELEILADRDKDGYLLQIFTQPLEDRPTLFFEFIERHGSQGFGEGNFKSLFEAIEREQARRGNL
ncbi:MAG: 4-hydroxyphenylpyruvate dioxygenase [Prochloraceae cyanobacterium]|nr:4-hydroxyphenylpyruvate dioxygenase [Prochloraceae cyanobacterium]